MRKALQAQVKPVRDTWFTPYLTQIVSASLVDSSSKGVRHYVANEQKLRQGRRGVTLGT
ncbi:hypothetical protein [Rubellicoccus peritrichatus]|uniref:Uncharacterized protein n=1 Tax=Rubellicoccus peritrichatus TaxID=3080537 RepID=A0AAQ3L7D2_9BACT|nr:hypothetical protein [Puniceicoccus sp. CR14]WOO40640.1 hypothetical protein RZN69_18620 [Puniceicoccus sp. CR14]